MLKRVECTTGVVRGHRCVDAGTIGGARQIDARLVRVSDVPAAGNSRRTGLPCQRMAR